VTHAFARTFEKTCRIVEPGTEEKPDIYVRRENINVAESGIANAGRGMAIVKKFMDVIAEVAHQLEPRPRYASKGVRLCCKPTIDVWIVLDGTIKSEQSYR